MPSTRAAYLSTAAMLCRSCVKNGMKCDAHGLSFALKTRAPQLRPASLRAYRRAAVFWLEDSGHYEEAEALRFVLSEEPKAGLRKRKLVKRVPSDLYAELLVQLEGTNTKLGRQTAALVTAIAVCGLRPMEWQRAALRGNVLEVVNAKFEAGNRGNGPLRRLELLGNVTAEERTAIEATIEWLGARSYRKVQPDVHRAFKLALGGAVKRLRKSAWFMNLRIYDFRHQFAANGKAEWGVAGNMVAAAMGHASAETAVVHYGRRRTGVRGAMKVRPLPDSVAAVRKSYTPRPAAAPDTRLVPVAPPRQPTGGPKP